MNFINVRLTKFSDKDPFRSRAIVSSFECCFYSLRYQTHKALGTYMISLLQVFSYAKVYLGTGGNQFTGEPVHFSYIPDQVLEQAPFESGKRKINPFSFTRQSPRNRDLSLTFRNIRARFPRHSRVARKTAKLSPRLGFTSPPLTLTRFIDALLVKRIIKVGGPENWNLEIE